MKRLSTFSVLFFAFSTILLSAPAAFACQCVDPGSTCERVGGYEAVFVGKVIALQDDYDNVDENGNVEIFMGGQHRFFTLQVEERFQGVKNDRIVVATGRGGGDCGFPFAIGETYLVFARRGRDGQLVTSICSGTKTLDQANNDLTALRNPERKGSGGRVYGSVIGYGADGAGYRIQGLSGIPVLIVGPRKYRTVTDNAGDFEIGGVRAGTYRIGVHVPWYYLQEDLSEEIHVNGRGCLRQFFVPAVDNRVSGRVVDENGEVLEDATVSLIPAGSTIVGWDDSDADVDTEENGTFSFEKVPPGRYLLGVNLNDSPGQSFPYRSTYFPGVTNRADAQVIEIGLGVKLTNMTLRVFGKLVVHDVRGQVVWPDGRLATKAHIYLGYLDETGEWQVTGSADADEEGRFTIAGFEGYGYLLQAYVLNGKEGQPDYLAAHAPATKFRLNEDRDGFRLVLSLEGYQCDECEKATSSERP